MALAPGTSLHQYEIVSLLGAGGMGEVYRARDTRLGRDVALKVLPEAFAADSERLGRFEREAKTLASLNHPHIAQIHGFEESPSSGPAQGVRALVMELVEGEDLAQRLARGAIPIADALPIAIQIAEALEAAHEQGIIHRYLAYTSTESGRSEVYLRSFPEGARKWQVSIDGGSHLVWARDGHTLLFRDRARHVVAVDVLTSPDVKLSAPRVLFEDRYTMSGYTSVANYDVSADGQRFAMVRDDGAVRIAVLVNYFDRTNPM